MQKYKKWIVIQGDNQVFSGSWKKLCNKYNVTDEQMKNMLITQTFPFGFIKSETDFFNWDIDENTNLNGNQISFIKSLIRKSLITLLDKTGEQIYSVDEVMDMNVFNTDIIKEIVKNSFHINSRVEIIKHNGRNYLYIVLPHNYHGDVWPLSDFDVIPDKNKGYRMIIRILKSIQQSIIDCKIDPTLQTKIYYHYSGYYNWKYDMHINDAILNYPIDLTVYDREQFCL